MEPKYICDKDGCMHRYYIETKSGTPVMVNWWRHKYLASVHKIHTIGAACLMCRHRNKHFDMFEKYWHKAS